MDFLKNLIKRTVCNTRRYLDGKEKPKKTKGKGEEKEKKGQENQKNEVIKRKGKK